MVAGKQVKDCWGKNEGVGKMKKGEYGFLVENFKIFAPCAPPPPAVVVGKQVKDCWGKKLGAGKNEKRRKWFSSFLIFNFNN